MKWNRGRTFIWLTSSLRQGRIVLLANSGIANARGVRRRKKRESGGQEGGVAVRGNSSDGRWGTGRMSKTAICSPGMVTQTPSQGSGMVILGGGRTEIERRKKGGVIREEGKRLAVQQARKKRESKCPALFAENPQRGMDEDVLLEKKGTLKESHQPLKEGGVVRQEKGKTKEAIQGQSV